MGTFGPIGIEASGRWGKMGIGRKWAPGKMSTRANQQLGQMGTLEQMGTLRPMDIGENGHRRENGLQEK